MSRWILTICQVVFRDHEIHEDYYFWQYFQGGGETLTKNKPHLLPLSDILSHQQKVLSV